MIWNEELAAGLMSILQRLEAKIKYAHNNGQRRRAAKLKRKYSRWLKRCKTIGHVTPDSIRQYLERAEGTGPQYLNPSTVALSVKAGMRQSGQ